MSQDEFPPDWMSDPDIPPETDDDDVLIFEESEFEIEDDESDFVEEIPEETYSPPKRKRRGGKSKAQPEIEDDESDFVEEIPEEETYSPPKRKRRGGKSKAPPPKKVQPKTKEKAKVAKKTTPMPKTSATIKRSTPVKRSSPVKRSRSRSSASKPNGTANKKPKQITNPSEAKNVIVDYLKTTNRPYSAINIYDNIHGCIKKAHVVKFLEELADDEVIFRKTFGKSFKVYLANQNDYDEIPLEDLQKMDEEIKELNSTLRELQNQAKDLKTEVTSLKNQMTIEEIIQKLKKAEQDIMNKTQQLEKAKESIDSGEAVETSEIDNLKQNIFKYSKRWRQLSRSCKDMADTALGESAMSITDFYEKAGVETDKEVNINGKEIFNFVDSLNKR